MKTVCNVEIFRAGTWRGVGSPPGGDHYNREDLQAMVDAFNGGAIRPKIKITHGADAEQVNIGEVGNLKLVGTKLQGDFTSLDSSLYELMKKGLFNKRSAEVLWNMRDRAGKTWRRVLKAVALLAPGQKPAVSLTEGYQFQAAYCYEVPHKEVYAMNRRDAQRILDRKAKDYLNDGKAKDYREALTMAFDVEPEASRIYLAGPKIKEGKKHASAEIDELAREYVQQGKAPNYDKAVMVVFIDRPDLKARYVRGG
jgi:hypothetical protein